MPIRTECPFCQTPLNVPDAAAGKKVSCPKCAYGFVAEGDAPPPTASNGSSKKAAEPARSPAGDRLQGEKSPPRSAPEARASDRLQREPSSRRSAPDRRREDDEDEDLTRRKRRDPDIRKSGGVSPGVIIGVSVGGLVLLVGGVLLLVWGLRSKEPESAPASNAPAVAQGPQAPMQQAVQPAPGAQPAPPPVDPGPGIQPVAEAPRADAGARPVPEAPAAPGGEQFVDLPERNEGLPELPGGLGQGHAQAPPPQNPGAPPAMGAPGGRQRVQLTGGRVSSRRGRGGSGMVFSLSYRFVEGGPAGAGQYVWIVRAAGRSYEMRLRPGQLRMQGTLSGRTLGIPVAGPYEMYLVVKQLVPGRLGLQEERISDVLTIR